MATEPQASAVRPRGSDDDESVAAELRLAFQLLDRAIKNIRIYRHAEARFLEYVDPVHRALTKILDENETIPLKLGPYTLEYKRQVVYEDQAKENLTYKFYRDGMRFLILRRGLGADELLRFVLLALEDASEAARFQEDWITRLWKEEFRSIEYVVVEGFAFGHLSEEEVEIQVEKIVGHLRNQLRANSDDFTRFARLSPADLELELTEIEQVRGGIIAGRTSTPEERAKFQEDLKYEEQKRLFAKTVLILFQILELDLRREDTDLMLDCFTQVLDSLLLSEDVKGAVALLERFEAVLTKPLPADRVLQIRTIAAAFRRRMVEPQRLDAVGQHLALSRKMDKDAVRTYLSVASEEELIKITDMLCSMERSEGRRLLVDVLATIGRNHSEVFARRLSSNSSPTVRDMLAIIDRIRPPDRVSMFARCLEHPNVMVRLEGLKILAKASEPEALRHIERAIQDSDIQIRLAGYRALAMRDGERAAPILIRTMQSADYAAMDPRERVAVATAVGETRSTSAFQHLVGVLEQRAGLFARGKLTDAKLMAITGLQAFGSVDAFQALAREVENRSNAKEVIQAAQKAALRVKATLEQGDAKRSVRSQPNTEAVLLGDAPAEEPGEENGSADL